MMGIILGTLWTYPESLVKLLHLEVGQIAAEGGLEVGKTDATGPTTLSQRMSFADSHESSEANN